MSIAPVSSLSAFFSTAVRAAFDRCSLSADDAIERYLGALLAERAATIPARTSVVLELDRALAQPPELREEALRSVGDHALYVSGFFGVPPRDEPVFVHCGTLAFSRAARTSATRAALFDTLSSRFVELSNVLAEVAVAQSLGAQTRDLVRLYDAWKRSRSPSALDAMTDAGVFPSSTESGDA